MKSRILLFSLIILTSCSWLEKRRALFESSSSVESPSSRLESKEAFVTKTQYNQLLKKYEDLLKKVDKAEALNVQTKSMMAKGIQGSKHSEQGQMIAELSKIQPKADLAETVDVFGKGGLVDKANLQKRPEMTLSDNQIKTQLTMLQKANKLVAQNKMDSSLILLKELEESPNKQIQVRAKFYLAEMLFRQNEYDLAMQMYEEIVKEFAFSGLVIKSLGRLIVCSEKLKLNKKQEKYYSILHDFFEEA